MNLSNFRGTGVKLNEGDVLEAARTLDVTPAHVAAVVEVESAGRGFHPQTRMPIILFEPHIFHRETRGLFDEHAPLLSYARRGVRPYPRSQAARYRQLLAAAALDEDAALRSASWGLFQIMGFNHEPAGFEQVRSFVEAMKAGERSQLLAFCGFLVETRLAELLRANRWTDFARRYNGPDFARHGYDQRLKAAFARQQIRAARIVPGVRRAA